MQGINAEPLTNIGVLEGFLGENKDDIEQKR